VGTKEEELFKQNRILERENQRLSKIIDDNDYEEYPNG